MDSKASASTLVTDSPQSIRSLSAHLEIDLSVQSFDDVLDLSIERSDPPYDDDSPDLTAFEAMMRLSLEPRIRSGAHVLVEKVTRSKAQPLVKVLRLP